LELWVIGHGTKLSQQEWGYQFNICESKSPVGRSDKPRKRPMGNLISR
jgi:hypothetical protein